MSSCNLSFDSIEQAIIRTAAQLAVNSHQFERIGENLLRPTAEDVTEMVARINDSFQEPILKAFHPDEKGGNREGSDAAAKAGDYLIQPSHSLVMEGLRLGNLRDEATRYAQPTSNQNNYTKEFLFEQANIHPESNPLDFVKLEVPEAETFLKANPKLSVHFEQGTDSQFDPFHNSVHLDLNELYNTSQATNLPFREVVSIFAAHEMAHAASYYALETGKNAAFIQALYDQVVKQHGENPFTDALRQGYTDSKGLAYSFKDLHEFVADTFSNPYFKEYLQAIPVGKNRSVWDKIIDFFRSLVGLNPKDSVYDQVVNYITSRKMQEANEYGASQDLGDPQMILTYKGMPRSYADAAYEFLTGEEVSRQLADTFQKLPQQMGKLKRELDFATNDKHIRHIQSLLGAYNEIKDSEKVVGSYLNMLTTAVDITTDLNKQMVAATKMADDNNKVNAMYSIYLATKGLRFITPLINDIIRVSEANSYSTEIDAFINKLKSVVQLESSVRQNFVSNTFPAVKKYFASLNPHSSAYAGLHAQLNKFEEKLKDPATTTSNQQHYTRKIAEVRQQLLLIPSPETFDKIFSGDYKDASMSEANLEAIAMNSHPLIQGVFSLLHQVDMHLSQEMVAVENMFAHQQKQFIQSTGTDKWDMDKVHAPIMDRVDTIESLTEDEHGQLKLTLTPVKMFLSAYDPKYLAENFRLQKTKEFYKGKRDSARYQNDLAGVDRYQALYEGALKEQQTFQRENSELRYRPEVYAMFDLMDKELTKDDGTKTTYRRERGDIFTEITEVEHKRDSAPTMEEQKTYQDQLNQLHIDLQEIKSPWALDGKEKTGFAKQLSEVANEYSTLRNQYGKYTLTEEGQASYDREKKDILDRFQQQRLSAQQRDALLKEIETTQVSGEFYQAYDQLFSYVAQSTADLMAIPEVASILKGIDKTKIKEGYQKIRQFVAAFRDNDGVINGQLFTQMRPELIKEIQAIQHEVENLKNETSKLKGLSLSDNRKLSELYAKKGADTLTEDEKVLMEKLQEERAHKKEVYNTNKAAIDTYYELIKKLSELMSTTESTYYLAEKDRQLNLLIQSEAEKLREEVKTTSQLEGGKYYQKDDRWYRLEATGADGEKVVSEIKPQGGYSAEEQIVAEVSKQRAEKNFTESSWWKDNHYTAYSFDSDINEYVPVERSIYIWNHSTPTDSQFVTKAPAFRFKTYQISEAYQNQNHSEIFPGVPINKAGKFENTRFKTLTSSTNAKDQGYKKYLEFLRAQYRGYQELYPEQRGLGDILPGIARTHDEQKIDTLQHYLRADTYKNLFALSGGVAADDTQLLTGGGQKKIEESNRHVPTRFLSFIEADRQSSNLPAMILAFALATKRYTQFSQMQPLLETVRTITNTLDTKETLSLAHKFSIRGLVAAVKGESEKVTRNKQTEQTNLSKTMDYLLDTFFYEQKKEESTFNLLGMQVDAHKLVGGLKHTFSRSIFAMNTFLAAKNTVAAKVMSLVNSNMGEGFYTNTDYAKGQAKAVQHVQDFLKDYTKAGGKTFIGQALQYFQVLHGDVYSEYGKKTQWTFLKDAGALLTLAKNASEAELQITQFLAMSYANMVEVDGKMVPFLDAFELNNDGNFAPKAGAKVDQATIDRFTMRLTYINRMINGAYREDEKNRFQKTPLGTLAFYLGGYIMPGITNRFGSARYSIEGDMITKGYYNQTLQFVKEMAKYRRGVNEQWADMTTVERGRVLRFVKEISFVVGLGILTAAMGAGDDKKKLQANAPYYNYLLALAIATKSETETFIPLPSMGLNELSRKLNSPFAAMRQISNILKTVQNAADYVRGSNDAFYKTNGIHDGFHDKGDAKVVANFLKLLGYSGIEYTPLERLQNLQRAQIMK